MLFDNIGQPEVKRVFEKIIPDISFELYLVGGTLRNALYFNFFQERLLQRDFDIACPREKMEDFKKILARHGFSPGKLQGKDEFTMKIEKVSNPKQPSDYIVFDISAYDEADFWKKMDKVDFTIGGSALNFSYVLQEDWDRHLIGIPEAPMHIAEKKLQIHHAGVRSLFRAIRFIYMGFQLPREDDMKSILRAHEELTPEVRERNIKKLKDLVPEEKIREICLRLSIPANIIGLH